MGITNSNDETYKSRSFPHWDQSTNESARDCELKEKVHTVSRVITQQTPLTLTSFRVSLRNACHHDLWSSDKHPPVIFSSTDRAYHHIRDLRISLTLHEENEDYSWRPVCCFSASWYWSMAKPFHPYGQDSDLTYFFKFDFTFRDSVHHDDPFSPDIFCSALVRARWILGNNARRVWITLGIALYFQICITVLRIATNGILLRGLLECRRRWVRTWGRDHFVRHLLSTTLCVLVKNRQRCVNDLTKWTRLVSWIFVLHYAVRPRQSHVKTNWQRRNDDILHNNQADIVIVREKLTISLISASLSRQSTLDDTCTCIKMIWYDVVVIVRQSVFMTRSDNLGLVDISLRSEGADEVFSVYFLDVVRHDGLTHS